MSYDYTPAKPEMPHRIPSALDDLFPFGTPVIRALEPHYRISEQQRLDDRVHDRLVLMFQSQRFFNA